MRGIPRVMYTTITIFYVSILGIAALIFLKRREVLTGRASFVSKLGEGSDHIFAAFSRGMRSKLKIWLWPLAQVVLEANRVSSTKSLPLAMPSEAAKNKSGQISPEFLLVG